jgi:ubiquitin thioesterase protein OTUB1
MFSVQFVFQFLEYSEKIDHLRREHDFFRKIRPDGNCFYRAYLFGIIERAIKTSDAGGEIKLLRENLKTLAAGCKSAGYDGFAIDDFFEYIDGQLVTLSSNPTIEALRSQMFLDVSGDGYLVAFMRCCCGSFIKQNSEEFSSFLPSVYTSCDMFVRNEVDPMFKDCDNIQIVALARALQVPLRVVYLDQSDGPPFSLEFGPGDRSREVKLLYKPGHYDILY